MDFSEGQIKVLNAMQTGVLQAIQDSARTTQELLRQEIRASEYRVKGEIMGFIDDRLLPQIDALDTRLTKLETKPV